MIGLAAILIVLGVIAVWLGRRGVRSGPHPHCASCDFDLFGLPEDSQRCPECGAYIRVGDAIRLGKRRPVRTLAAAGILMILAGGWMGIQGVAGLDIDSSRLKPVTWLMSDMGGRNDVSQRRASQELVRRIEAGSISDAQLNDVLTWVLKKQADRSVIWRPAWGDVVQAAHRRERLGVQRWLKYLEQAVEMKVRTRPRVRLGDPVPVEVVCTLRAGRELREIAPGWAGVGVLAGLSGAAAKDDLGMNWQTVEATPGALRFAMLWLPGGGGPGAAGEHKVTLEMRATLRDREGLEAVVTGMQEVSLEMLPRDKPSVALSTPRESLVREMEEVVKLRGSGEVKASAGAPVGTLWIAGPPMAGAFRVELRQGSREWVLARVLVRPDDAVYEALRLPTSRGVPEPGPAEVVLVPEPQGAAGTVDVLEVWPGEIRRPVRVVE